MLNERLKQAREAKGLSQSECARRTGASQAAYSYYEQGLRTPSSQMLIRIADLLDVSLDWLVGRSDKEKTED